MSSNFEDAQSQDGAPHVIPNHLIDQWSSIDPDAELQIALTRRDFENLYLVMQEIHHSQKELQECVIELSKQNYGNANQHMRNSQFKLTNSIEVLKKFMHGVMKAVEAPAGDFRP